MIEMTVDEFKRKYRLRNAEICDALGFKSRNTLDSRIKKGRMSVIVNRGRYRIIETQGEGEI